MACIGATATHTHTLILVYNSYASITRRSLRKDMACIGATATPHLLKLLVLD